MQVSSTKNFPTALSDHFFPLSAMALRFYASWGESQEVGAKLETRFTWPAIPNTVRIMPFALLLSFFLAACAHPKPKSEEAVNCTLTNTGFTCPLTYKKYRDDLVTVQSTVDLAFNSYVLGCVTASREGGVMGSHEACREKAKKHLQDTVIFILDQNPKPVTPAEYRKSRLSR
jgi:hypothetical protein